MSKITSVKHPIQKHIVDYLQYTPIARFTDLKPPRVGTNLFTYHLNALVKSGVVEKTDEGYKLTTTGLTYVDRATTEKQQLRTQPKIISMLVVQNGDGDILLQRRTKQPFVNTWTLPYGKVHLEDKTVLRAGQREAFEKLGLENPEMTHAGDCYIRVSIKDTLISNTLVHVFRLYEDEVGQNENLVWARPHKLHEYPLAPAVEEIMTRTFFKDPFFFEEYDVNWYSEEHES